MAACGFRYATLQSPIFLLLITWFSLAHCDSGPSSAPCVIPVYMVKDACGLKKGVSHKCMVWENRYIVSVLLSGILPRCGCHVRLLDRQGAPEAISNLSNFDAPAMVLVAVFGLKAPEIEAIRTAGEHARRKLVVIHLNDEKFRLPHNSSWYPLVKAVFRNYHHDYNTLVRHSSYLLNALGIKPPPPRPEQPQHGMTPLDSMTSGAGSPGEAQPLSNNVFWIPLGFGENFFTSDVMQQAFATRPLLWSWVGSMGNKLERHEMIRCFRDPQLMGIGHLHVIQSYMSTEMLSPMRYSDLLHQSMLIPLPRGVHWEQYRLWEAFAAGAMPMALKVHKRTGLAHVQLLQFKIVWIDSWQHAPGLVMGLMGNGTMQSELGQWQDENSRRYREVMKVVAASIAHSVCEP